MMCSFMVLLLDCAMALGPRVDIPQEAAQTVLKRCKQELLAKKFN
jgi:hypothetical protein